MDWILRMLCGLYVLDIPESFWVKNWLEPCRSLIVVSWNFSHFATSKFDLIPNPSMNSTLSSTFLMPKLHNYSICAPLNFFNNQPCHDEQLIPQHLGGPPQLLSKPHILTSTHCPSTISISISTPPSPTSNPILIFFLNHHSVICSWLRKIHAFHAGWFSYKDPLLRLKVAAEPAVERAEQRTYSAVISLLTLPWVWMGQTIWHWLHGWLGRTCCCC